MSPSAISVTPPHGVKTSELTAAAVAQKISTQALELQPLDASKLKFTRTTTPMKVPEPDDPIIATASQCTDHMITAVWKSSTGKSEICVLNLGILYKKLTPVEAGKHLS
jgi:branched-chain amino acid aminotransferase